MPRDIEAIAEQVFAALADPTRRAILAELASRGPATATDLADRLPITRQAIAEHLALLAGACLVMAAPGQRRAGCATGCAPRPCKWRSIPGRAGPRLGRRARGIEGASRRGWARTYRSCRKIRGRQN